MTPREFAMRMHEAADRVEPALEELVVTFCEASAIKSRSYIGREMPEWAPLSNATMDGFRHPAGFYIPGKTALGYTGQVSATDPLLRTGQMRDSIEVQTQGLVGEVGSVDKVALYQEMGTPNAEFPIPPRPFLAQGMLDTLPELEGMAEAAWLSILELEDA